MSDSSHPHIPDPAVIDATAQVETWESARAVMLEAFTRSREAAASSVPVVYVVHGDDLLGRRGAASAMVATGLLSAARTAAIELTRAGVPVNVIAIDADTDPGQVSRWTRHLAEPGGPTGTVIHLTPSHLGKALP